MSIEITDRVLTITRTFSAPPGRVYRAFVEPEMAARWMWAGMGQDPRAQIDLRVGGLYRIEMDDPTDDQWPGDQRAMVGYYVDIVPDRRLAYTLHWEAYVGYNTGSWELDEVIVVDFEPTDGGTTMTFRHLGIPDDGMDWARRHGEGWNESFNALEDVVVS